jgi:hypothetical protein
MAFWENCLSDLVHHARQDGDYANQAQIKALAIFVKK